VGITLTDETTNENPHFHLAAGEILFHETGNDAAAGSVRLNAMLVTQTANITASDIGRVQQALQLNFFQKTGDAAITIVDVVLLNLSYLGQMTQEEFQKMPDGVRLEQVAGAAPLAN
jgi:hypothetical protein